MANGLLNTEQESGGLLDTKKASDYLGVNDKSLANSRYTGTGMQIPYIKMGKIVRYRQSDLDAYIESNTFNHTGEVKGLLDVGTE
jgi:predicted DNA-binding transcriptional regulator AlpA